MMKRTKEMQKYYINCLKDIDSLIGECDAGLLISILLKLLRSLQRENCLNLRTIELKINDYFSAKWDFDKGDFVS